MLFHQTQDQHLKPPSQSCLLQEPLLGTPLPLLTCVKCLQFFLPDSIDRSQTSLIPRLPASSPTLFEAKKKKNLSFETIAKALGREEVACAALFYGQAQASAEDIKNLSKLLEIDQAILEEQLSGFPDRGRTMEMPPKEPLVYRLFEIIQNYGYSYKAVLNEKFGDGIMSAISFSTKIEKETDEKGDWAVITLRGKW